MTEDTQQTPKRRIPWGRVVLFLSLAVNLLILGLVVGAIAKGPKDRDRNPMARDLGMGPFVQALPMSERIALTKEMRGNAGGGFRENRAALRRDFEAFLEVLRAESFDPDAAGALLSAQRTRVSAWQVQGQEVLLQRLSAMSDAERQAYAERLAEKIKRRPSKKRK